MGHLAWSDIATSLAKIGYDGYVVVESFNPEGRLAPLARFWRPLFSSSDTLALEGLAFLKGRLREPRDLAG
jgi:D-psicose/D-tagatose/L-ribulose 3-epimerase